ncbi:B12-binding domain-containing radical SAM protein [Fusibacter sp. 3D3]|uniref:B12-binding domain-containing radical SAM protein n=1 Tax=Fusibacter sp. 3D3 TaxID=1048380 RepID=UPI0008530E93|nr:B12-binding domain-containing radical SAM protein [Fusibacter sp. 3D3]GAU79744.1 Fe-S oxidoreductase [Fusibacter sp. 3D3]
MKTLFMTLNSKYIHSNLAIHSISKYIKRYCTHYDALHDDVLVKEYTINQSQDDILRELIEIDADVIVCSSYIWNIEALIILFSNYRKLNHNSYIIFGGPEVSYDAKDKLEKQAFLDMIAMGEGERTITQVLDLIYEQFKNSNPRNALTANFSHVSGVAYRAGDLISVNSKRIPIEPLDEIPFVYDDFTPFENRILYYESSRGCPYSCSYCLSAAEKGVRFYSLERVFNDLNVFLEKKVSQVKFVDRTFNVDKEHALSILRYLIEHDNGITNFHFEMTATLFDEDYFKLLLNAREGLFQFEIGVQSTYKETMIAINRPIAFDKLKINCMRLLKMGNIHIHLDLIAGLPHEGYERFLRSFDDVFEMNPHALQLGFLKILKGTPIMATQEKHGYEFRKQTPYEVLYNRYIRFEDLTKLKNLETVLEYYYNSGKFKHSIQYLLKTEKGTPSDFFLKLCDYFKAHDLMYIAHSTANLYDILYEFYQENYENHALFNDLLKFDYYYAHMKGLRPFFVMSEIPQFNTRRLHYLKALEHQELINPFYVGMQSKQILKTVEFITLNYDIIALIQSQYEFIEAKLNVVLFDYQRANHAIEPSKYFKVELPVI